MQSGTLVMIWGEASQGLEAVKGAAQAWDERYRGLEALHGNGKFVAYVSGGLLISTIQELFDALGLVANDLQFAFTQREHSPCRA